MGIDGEPDSGSRRRFIIDLGKLAISGIAAATTPHFISHEGQKLMNRYFSINSVRYFPFYENHERGFEGELPGELDVVFFELNTDDPNTLYRAEGIDINIELLQKTIDQLLRTGQEEHLFLKILQERGSIAIGDVGSKLIDNELDQMFSDQGRKMESARFVTGLSGILVKALLPNKSTPSNQTGEVRVGFNRREFLKNIAFMAGSIAVLNSRQMSVFLAQAEQIYGKSPAAAMTNVLFRLSGLASNFRPEETIVFFRNLILADKILLLGEHYSKVSPQNKLPQIGYKLGKLHSGIEDVLYLGRPAIHELLLAFYEEFLKKNFDVYEPDFIKKVRILKFEDAYSSQGELYAKLVDDATLHDQELEIKLQRKFPQYFLNKAQNYQ